MSIKNQLVCFLKRSHLLDILLCLFLGGCAAHTGVEMVRSGETLTLSNENHYLLPKIPTGFRVAPGDVIRIDTSFQNLKDKPFLLEREDILIISFSYDKGEYRIMPGDGLLVNFIAESRLDFETVVRLDGKLTIPKIGDVSASGKTPAELSNAIEERFKGKMKNPRTTVSVINTNLEPIVRMTNEYRILPDGKISIPILGTFDAAGLSVKELSINLSEVASKYFKNDFKASVVRKNFITQSLLRYDRIVTITPAGEIILPGVGDLNIRGMSLPEVKRHIQTSLQGIYENPIDATLTLISAASRSVYVSGQVRLPGVYPLAPDITTLKAIMMAGGVTHEGSLNEVVLIHYENNGTISVYKTNLSEVIDQGDIVQDLPLSPQDVVYVPMTDVADANKFIKQYIDNMLPFVRGVNYNYNKNPDLSGNQ